MVYFFFYNKLTNPHLLNKISDQIKIYDGYITITSYDDINHIISFSEQGTHNHLKLHGKLVQFDNMTLATILKRITQIAELCDNNRKYTLRTILVQTSADITHEAFVLY